MSAGQSNSVGTDSSTGYSTGQSQTKGWQQQKQATTYSNDSVQSTNVPLWARALNKEIATGSAADSSQARDFLTGLLSNPYDQSSPHNRFADAISRNFAYQLAQARGGTSQTGIAKQGFREGAALSNAQDQSIGQGITAANSLLTNANPMAALDWERLIAPVSNKSTGTALTTGNTQTAQDTDTSGRQSSFDKARGHTSGSGITICCFIFLESYNGKLPWFVRKCRDQFASGPRVEGYRKMSKHLVALMHYSFTVRLLVNLLMVWPLTLFGGWLYHQPKLRYRFGWALAPVVAFWFTLWAFLGKTINFEPNE